MYEDINLCDGAHIQHHQECHDGFQWWRASLRVWLRQNSSVLGASVYVCTCVVLAKPFL